MKRSLALPSPVSVSFFRGLYGRVAKDLRVDASYVSRVARGQRSSGIVENAIRREMGKVLTSVKNGSPWSAKRRTKK